MSQSAKIFKYIFFKGDAHAPFASRGGEVRTPSSFKLFIFFCFLNTFQLSFSVRWIKLTHVGFRAHVKVASRIVS